jgi:hypothetical protein
MPLSNAGIALPGSVIAPISTLAAVSGGVRDLEAKVDTLRIGRSSLECISWLRAQSRAGELVQWISSLCWGTSSPLANGRLQLRRETMKNEDSCLAPRRDSVDLPILVKVEALN